MEEIIAGRKFGVIQKLDSPLISKNDVNLILTNTHLHNRFSYYGIEAGQDESIDNRKNHFDRINEIEERLKKSNTIKVENLENWNEAVRDRAQSLSQHTTVHMFLSPKIGYTFDFHEDDNDVLVHMQHGEKVFILKDKKGVEHTFQLKPGDVLYIPRGMTHKAIAHFGSCHLSFGLANERTTKMSHASYPVDIDLGWLE